MRERAGLSKMAEMEKLVNNNSKRQEQLQRWEESETNLEPVTPKRERNTVKFQNGCMFLAACSSGDQAEVERLLRNQRNADINITNVDGLTALHQACIDDNIDMVRFLVEHGAEVNVYDNEGWTPLHATASCGFLDIARYLIDQHSNVAAVNNDGDLPIDITENEDMQNLLQEEMDRLGVDAESARCLEEQQMLEDANNFLASKSVKEVRHPKTGATALHVAAAKGYIKVLEILLKAGADIDAEDFDGWTPLHAAVHWNQKESCKLLVEHMCNMFHKNKAGHTVFDIAEGDMVKLLEDQKDKQASAKKEKEFNKDIILEPATDRRQGLKRSMSGDSRNSIISQTSEDERIHSSLRGDKADNKNLNGVTVKSDKNISDPTDKTKPAAQSPQSSELPGYGSSTKTPKLGTETDSKFGNRSSSFNFGQDYSGYRSIYASRSSNYVPYYLQRQQKESLAGSGTTAGSVDRPGSTEPGPPQDTVTTTTTASSSSTSTTTTSNSSPTNPTFRRSYEVPKRDEETETKRKARAKHARQTRRSTQGVSLEDIEKAEESIQHNKDTTSESSTSATQLSSARTSSIRRAGGATDGRDTGISTASGATTTVSAAVSTRAGEVGTKEDRSITSGYQSRTSEGKNDPTDAAVSARTSFRRSREDRAANLLTGSTDLSTTYVPRSQRLSNSQTTEGVTPAPSGRSSLRPTAAYSDVTSSKTDDDSKKNESSGEKKESTSIRARRQRRERRSTGIGLDGEDGENKDNKSDEETNDETDQSSQNGPVTSEPTSHLRQSFRSSDTLDQFYKKKYEDIKGENEQIRKEMEQIKKELAETKAAAERTSRLRDNARNSEPDKKRLEKKLAELEEEVKKMEAIKADNLRLKDENGALIRVISKLSKPS